MRETTTSYSQIKRVTPELVIVCLSFDDVEAFQLMSMLKLDRDTSTIPVVMCCNG
jgi:PleD family two-component response regulator